MSRVASRPATTFSGQAGSSAKGLQMSEPATHVRLKGNCDGRIADDADVEIIVPITSADPQWVHLFNATVEEYEARSDRTVRATSREVTIIAMSGRAEAAPDWVSGIAAGLDWVRETIDKTNVARRALEQAG